MRVTRRTSNHKASIRPMAPSVCTPGPAAHAQINGQRWHTQGSVFRCCHKGTRGRECLRDDARRPDGWDGMVGTTQAAAGSIAWGARGEGVARRRDARQWRLVWRRAGRLGDWVWGVGSAVIEPAARSVR